MGRFNEGIVYTNDQCVGCNKCISVCPAMGANVSIRKDLKTSVNVSQKCINCGLCVSACDHDARVFRDDTLTLLEALEKGEKISLLVDPAFYIDYGDKAKEILGYFKSLGVNKIYDVAYGAEISAFFHARFLKENSEKGRQCRQYVANSCAAIVRLFENVHPNLLPLLIPVHSPLACTAIYVHKYLKDDSKLAYISPCISQSEEIKRSGGNNAIAYNVTFSGIYKNLRKVDMSGMHADADLVSDGVGNISSNQGGFLDIFNLMFDKDEITNNYTSLDDYTLQFLKSTALSESLAHPLLVTINGCSNGCVLGNGVHSRDIRAVDIIDEYKKRRKTCFDYAKGCKSSDILFERLMDIYKELDMIDFLRTYKDDYRQPYRVPEDVIQDIFMSMHKDTKTKQTVNCQACGYKSCHDMAVATANGYARIQDCVHYMNDDLKFSALVDAMTGIPNTNGFRKKANELLEQNPGKEYMLFVGNVNKLKNVNDFYGTDMGDKVLCYIAKRLEEITTGKGTCGRFGGGIFAVFLENKYDYVSSFMKHTSVEVKHLGVYFPITIRFGVMKIKDSGTKLSEVSNLCTYAADKATNRTTNTYIEFTDSMRQEMQIETDLTLNMRDAMDNGEFVLYLQPQYDHATRKIVGAEALCRWIRPDGSIVSPGLFIPVFERNGFVKDLDKYVWESAFKLVQSWEQAKVPMVPISVNISRVSLETDEIVDVIGKLSEKYPINKSNLYFEITESAYMRDQFKLVERVSMIKALGFKIAMDDFGSGYSSLNSLKDIPIDVLKLDMGFLRGGTNIERGNEIISHMVDMAKALELRIVAEGVETKDQADFLTDRGCDVIQGFYYARPMPLGDYEERLNSDL